MTIDDKVIPWVIAGVGVFFTGLSLWYSRRKDARQAVQMATQAVAQEAKADASVRMDLEYIKRGVDDIRVDQQRMREDMGRMAERVTRVEESCKSMHHRLDQHINLHPPD